MKESRFDLDSQLTALHRSVGVLTQYGIPSDLLARAKTPTPSEQRQLLAGWDPGTKEPGILAATRAALLTPGEETDTIYRVLPRIGGVIPIEGPVMNLGGPGHEGFTNREALWRWVALTATEFIRTWAPPPDPPWDVPVFRLHRLARAGGVVVLTPMPLPLIRALAAVSEAPSRHLDLALRFTAWGSLPGSGVVRLQTNLTEILAKGEAGVTGETAHQLKRFQRSLAPSESSTLPERPTVDLITLARSQARFEHAGVESSPSDASPSEEAKPVSLQVPDIPAIGSVDLDSPALSEVPTAFGKDPPVLPKPKAPKVKRPRFLPTQDEMTLSPILRIATEADPEDVVRRIWERGDRIRFLAAVLRVATPELLTLIASKHPERIVSLAKEQYQEELLTWAATVGSASGQGLIPPWARNGVVVSTSGRLETMLPDFGNWLRGEGMSEAAVHNNKWQIRQILQTLPTMEEVPTAPVLQAAWNEIRVKLKGSPNKVWGRFRDYCLLYGIELPLPPKVTEVPWEPPAGVIAAIRILFGDRRVNYRGIRFLKVIHVNSGLLPIDYDGWGSFGTTRTLNQRERGAVEDILSWGSAPPAGPFIPLLPRSTLSASSDSVYFAVKRSIEEKQQTTQNAVVMFKAGQVFSRS